MPSKFKLFSKSNLLILILMVSFACAATAKQTTSNFKEGKDYTKVDSSVRNKDDIAQLLQQNPGKNQILFFFSYGCHACAKFDPYFEQWLNKHGNGKAIVYRFPVIFDDEWEPLSKMYYAMASVDPKLSLNDKVFTAIHTKKMHLWDESEMEEFIEKNGLNLNAFEKAYDSDKVEKEADYAQKVSLSYQVMQTPTVIINTPSISYRVTIGGANPERCIQVLNYLLSKNPSKTASKATTKATTKSISKAAKTNAKG